MKRWVQGVLCAAAIGSQLACGGNSVSMPVDSPESMFGPPPAGATATPGKVYGLWGGSGSSGSAKFDMRVRVTATDTTIAARCSFDDGTMLEVSASAASRVTEKPAGDPTCFPIKGKPSVCGEVTMLESKSDRRTLGDKWCSVDLKPTPHEYAIAGLDLQFESDGELIDLVKISD